jgi:RNA polymerase sigma-70 factor (sigma-E family)
VRASQEQDYREWALARRDQLRRTAFLLCGDWHLADDVTQTALIKMYAAWPRIRSDDKPDAYAHRVLVNAWLDERRRPWRRSERGSERGGDHPVTAGLPDLTDQALTRQVVLRALAALAPRQRAVIVLRYWEDLSVQQTASVLSCSVGTVKSQTSKAHDRLRTLLGDRVDDFAHHASTASEDR